MGALRELLETQSFQKIYPDPKDQSVARDASAGRRVLQDTYVGKYYPWILGGHKYKFDPNLRYATCAPANRTVEIGKFPVPKDDSIPQILAAVSGVRLAGNVFFRTTTVQTRIALLNEISKVIRERFWLLVAAGMYETGQSLAEAIGEVDEAVDFPLATAMYLEELHENRLWRSPPWAGDFNGYRYVPHGVFLNIEPFNFPIAIPVDMAVKALAMGNAVIMKPSDKSSLCGFLVYECIVEALKRRGIAEHNGVVSYCPGGPRVVDMLLASPDIAGVSFTGSSAALDEIKQKYGRMPRNKFRGRSPLNFGSTETSGVNVVAVWKDAVVDRAARECAKSFLGRSGQKCSSARVILVHNDVIHEFSRALEAEIEKVRYGSVLQGADLGPLITQAAEEQIAAQILSLQKQNIVSHTYVKKSRIAPSLGLSVAMLPTILYAGSEILHRQESNAAHTLMNTEIFGPVTTVVPVYNQNNIERLCNLSEFGLTSSGFTEDTDIAVWFDNVLPGGNAYLNRKCTGALVESECFGGLSSRSSPSGIKGKNALALFASEQIASGFYGDEWTEAESTAYVDVLKGQGFVFSKT